MKVFHAKRHHRDPRGHMLASLKSPSILGNRSLIVYQSMAAGKHFSGVVIQQSHHYLKHDSLIVQAKTKIKTWLYLKYLHSLTYK